jgi:TPR repeat protein
MVNLGAMIAGSHPDQARRWFERAAGAGDPQAMVNLAILLADSDPEQARRWRDMAIASTAEDPSVISGRRLTPLPDNILR